MEVRLVVGQGRQRKVFELTGPSAVIGRSRGNTVRIPSAEVSRRHCRLRMRDGQVTIEDLDSVNGTFLNGARVVGTEAVGPSDRIEVGPVTFVVEYELSMEPLGLDDQGSPFEVLGQARGEEVGEGLEVVGEELEVAEGLEVIEEGPVLELELGPERKQHWSQEDPELVAVEEEVVLDLFPDEPEEAPPNADMLDLLADMEDARTSRQKKPKKT